MFIAALGICDEPPTAEEVMSLAIQAVLVDKDESCYAPVVAHLMQAWGELRTKEIMEATGKDVDFKWVERQNAEDVYFKAYTTVRGREDDWSWPDAMPYDDPLPRQFIIEIARAIARKDIAEEKAFFEYARKQEKNASTD